MAKGALPYQELLGVPGFCFLGTKNVQPASIDLRLAEDHVFRLRGEVIPQRGEPLDHLLERTSAFIHQLQQPLEPGGTYLALCAGIEMPGWLFGRINPKSSTGRVDLHVRSLLPGVPYYDSVPSGFKGQIWLMITSNHFQVMLHRGDALAQLRVFDLESRLDATSLRREFATNPLVWNSAGTPLSYEEAVRDDLGALVLTVDLSGEVIGYVARPLGETDVFDFARRDYEPERFFEVIRRKDRERLYLSPGRFYILRTRERIAIPPHLTGEMAPLMAEAGDIRAHYAGFFDPGFGYGRNGELKGLPAVMEVRTFGQSSRIIEHGDFFGIMHVGRMREVPERIYGETGSHYADQEGPRLSKHFKR